MYISPYDLLQVESKIADEINLALPAAESRSEDSSTIAVPAMQLYQNQASLWGSHDEVVIVNARHASTAAEYIMALQNFNREPIVSRKTDPLNWWKSRVMESHNLYEVAKKFMSVPATCVLSESVFQCWSDNH